MTRTREHGKLLEKAGATGETYRDESGKILRYFERPQVRFHAVRQERGEAFCPASTRSAGRIDSTELLPSAGRCLTKSATVRRS